MKLQPIAIAMACLSLGACETVQETYFENISSTYTAELLGQNQVGRGDPDASGVAEISIADELTRVCWDLNELQGLGPITGVHIHRGRAGVDGPVVMPLSQATEGGWRGCSRETGWVQQAFDEGLDNYYVNVHTAEYPQGAIRGQLRQ
jgi:hypothetical protein